MIWALIFARLCLAAVFLYSGASKAQDWPAAMTEFAALGLSGAALVLTIAVQLGAGAALALGWHLRAAAVVLALFTLAATVIGHPFWTFAGPEFQRQLTIAFEHLAITGGLVLLCLHPQPVHEATPEARRWNSSTRS